MWYLIRPNPPIKCKIFIWHAIGISWWWNVVGKSCRIQGWLRLYFLKVCSAPLRGGDDFEFVQLDQNCNRLTCKNYSTHPANCAADCHFWRLSILHQYLVKIMKFRLMCNTCSGLWSHMVCFGQSVGRVGYAKSRIGSKRSAHRIDHKNTVSSNGLAWCSLSLAQGPSLLLPKCGGANFSRESVAWQWWLIAKSGGEQKVRKHWRPPQP